VCAPALVNALNYVHREWNYKPCGFVSYGGVSGGLRAVQLERQLVTTLKRMSMVEGVAVPMVAKLLDEQRDFVPNELIVASANTLLDAPFLWAEGLKAMRERNCVGRRREPTSRGQAMPHRTKRKGPALLSIA
jgi:NAD(P)H-dependent FMN reductase